MKKLLLVATILLWGTTVFAQGVTIRRTDGTETGTSTTPLRVDPTGSTTQPVSLPAGGSPADAETNTNAPLSRIGVYNFFYNGTTWDRMRGDTTNGLFVNVKTSVLPTGAAADATLSTMSGKLPAALDGSGFLKTHEQGTAAISAASLPLPTGAAADSSLTTIDTDLKANIVLKAGTNVIGKVGIDQTTPGTTNAVEAVPDTASGVAVSECDIVSAASTNSTSCKGSAGNFYGYEITNTTTTVYYLRIYNTAAAPTCSSATGFIRSIPIPPAAAAGQVGGIINNRIYPFQMGTGIGYCITGGSSSTDNTNAAIGIFGRILLK